MKLKPFTFEEWSKDTSQAVYTTKGVSVCKLSIRYEDGQVDLSGAMCIGSRPLQLWNIAGSYYYRGDYTSEYDLMLVEAEGEKMTSAYRRKERTTKHLNELHKRMLNRTISQIFNKQLRERRET